jgi:hypothetical protein
VSEGELLTGDGVTQGIVRIGDTVRRPLRPFSLTVQGWAAVDLARRYHEDSRASAELDPVYRKLWEDGAKHALPRAEAWLREAAPAITARLSQPA